MPEGLLLRNGETDQDTPSSWSPWATKGALVRSAWHDFLAPNT
jgi:hypothetical protein